MERRDLKLKPTGLGVVCCGLRWSVQERRREPCLREMRSVYFTVQKSRLFTANAKRRHLKGKVEILSKLWDSSNVADTSTCGRLT